MEWLNFRWISISELALMERLNFRWISITPSMMNEWTTTWIWTKSSSCAKRENTSWETRPCQGLVGSKIKKLLPIFHHLVHIGGYGYRYRCVLMLCPASAPPVWVCICFLCVWCMCSDVVPCIWKGRNTPPMYMLCLCPLSMSWCCAVWVCIFFCCVMYVVSCPVLELPLGCPCCAHAPQSCYSVVRCVPYEGVWRSLQSKFHCGVQEKSSKETTCPTCGRNVTYDPPRGVLVGHSSGGKGHHSLSLQFRVP